MQMHLVSIMMKNKKESQSISANQSICHWFAFDNPLACLLTCELLERDDVRIKATCL
jgi:hypothetical protein